MGERAYRGRSPRRRGRLLVPQAPKRIADHSGRRISGSVSRHFCQLSRENQPSLIKSGPCRRTHPRAPGRTESAMTLTTNWFRAIDGSNALAAIVRYSLHGFVRAATPADAGLIAFEEGSRPKLPRPITQRNVEGAAGSPRRASTCPSSHAATGFSRFRNVSAISEPAVARDGNSD